MRARLTKLLAGLTAVAALAFGGAALAGAASNPSTPALPPASAPADTTEQGDQTAPDTGSASEVPGNDGPGGHADEPGNANADHQFQGEE